TDLTPPQVTVDGLVTRDTTPQLTGTVDDPNATIVVLVDGQQHTATNSDGTWTLANDTLSPALADGTYDVSVSATDTAGNMGSDTTVDELTIDTTAPPSYHESDTNEDQVISDFELVHCLIQWASGQVGDFELLDAIDLWAAEHYFWDEGEGKFKPGQDSP
ncbi:MAG: hypothetical protein IIC50_23870, partial [Planctomycetes bacterium]|nr:hypothetical protein [Planctomycetota bacterium]